MLFMFEHRNNSIKTVHAPCRGQDIAVFTLSSQISRIFKDGNSYSFDPFIGMGYSGVGNVSREAKTILWRSPAEGLVSLHPNPKLQVLVHTGNNLLHMG
jgi:hypothetical protein